MKIRKGKTTDINNICKLLISTWQNCYTDFIPASFLVNMSVEGQIKRHEKYMASGSQYFIAENTKNEILGFTSYGNNRINEIDVPLELYTLYVDHEIQGKGVGTSLLNAIMGDVKPMGHSIAVSVFEKNPYKIFYLKQRFKKAGEELIDLGNFEILGGIYIKDLLN